MTSFDIKKFIIKPGTKIDLRKLRPDLDLGLTKEDGEERLEKDLKELEDLQYKFFADGSKGLIIVLQGIDTAGKDGTIRKVMSAFNPQGVYVKSFKAPEGQEKFHDDLRRVHEACPPRGNIAIFNRSHYEDVLVTRVHKIISEDKVKKRLGHINDFERMLVDEGTVIIKFFLNISKEEQLERLKSRLDDPSRNWKFSTEDIRERALWDDYIKVFNDTLTSTNTSVAPWWVVPSDNKWIRNLVVSEVIRKTFKDMRLAWPIPEFDLEKARRSLSRNK